MAIDVYTDGGCSGNPGPGAWAYVILSDGCVDKNSGFDIETTNNRMELTAVIRALDEVTRNKPQTGAEVSLYTDSRYVQKGMTEWKFGWIRNGWKTASKQPVKNRDLWIELICLAEKVLISWKWVRGHDGNEYNEMCDALVQEQLKKP